MKVGGGKEHWGRGSVRDWRGIGRKKKKSGKKESKKKKSGKKKSGKKKSEKKKLGKKKSEKKKSKKTKPKFEDVIEKIDTEILKRRGKWNLTILSWMDFDDVSQILRIHIYKKWHLYDPEKPLAPWLNRIISNQIKMQICK